MTQFNHFLLLLPICILLLACNKQQSDQTRETTAAKKDTAERDSLVEQIDVHPADSTVMEEETKPKTDKDSLPIVVIKKGGCYGNCPVYEARLYRDGRAEYHGRRYVDLVGNYTAHMDSAQIMDIYEKVDFIDYFSLADKYPVDSKPIADLPNTTTTIRKDGKEQTIINNSGAPRGLKDFEEYLQRTFQNLDWKSDSESDAQD